MAIAVVAALVITKDLDLLHRSGLVGYCKVAHAPPGDSAAWRACHSGRLSGRPDLSRSSCTRYGTSGDVQFWRCPAPVTSKRSTQ